MPGRHDQSTRSALETPAKKNSYEGKKSGTSGMEKYETESIKSYTASGCLEISKRISKCLNEQVFSNEKLQNDLNQSQHRAKISKQTVEVTSV